MGTGGQGRYASAGGGKTIDRNPLSFTEFENIRAYSTAVIDVKVKIMVDMSTDTLNP